VLVVGVMAIIFAPGATGQREPDLGPARLTAAVLAPTTTELATLVNAPQRRVGARTLLLAASVFVTLLLAVRRQTRRQLVPPPWMDVVSFDVPLRRGPPFVLA
jgi:hypothetical protein